jgi:hypothetical protein
MNKLPEEMASQYKIQYVVFLDHKLYLEYYGERMPPVVYYHSLIELFR